MHGVVDRSPRDDEKQHVARMSQRVRAKRGPMKGSATCGMAVCRPSLIALRYISSGHAHGKRARLGNARGDPSLWRAGATSIVGKDFLPAIAPKSPLSGRAMGVLQIAR